jgi:nicotinamidase-related amidase
MDTNSNGPQQSPPSSPRTGLVVVDMQNAFCQPGGDIYVGQAERQLPAIAEAIQLARSAQMPVIYTAVVWESPGDILAGLAIAAMFSRSSLIPIRTMLITISSDQHVYTSASEDRGDVRPGREPTTAATEE